MDVTFDSFGTNEELVALFRRALRDDPAFRSKAACLLAPYEVRLDLGDVHVGPSEITATISYNGPSTFHLNAETVANGIIIRVTERPDVSAFIPIAPQLAADLRGAMVRLVHGSIVDIRVPRQVAAMRPRAKVAARG